MSRVTPLDQSRRAPAKAAAPTLPTLEDLLGVERQAFAFSVRYQGFDKLPQLATGNSVALVDPDRLRTEALALRRRLPIRTELARVHEQVVDALRPTATPEIVRMLLGQLLSCYPGDKVGNPEVAFDALAFDLLDTGQSDVVVASACTRLRRTSKFRPAIAEVLDACAERRRVFEGVSLMLQRLGTRLLQVHRALHATGGDPDPAEVVFHCPLPGLEDEYAKGVGNRFWFDPMLNEALFSQDDAATGDEETDEAWLRRVRALKAAADQDPEGTAVRILEAEGAEAGREAARDYARRSGLGRRRDGLAHLGTLSERRFPGGEPAAGRQAWAFAADRAFLAAWDELLPDYDQQEHERGLRAEAEWRETMARRRGSPR